LLPEACPRFYAPPSTSEKADTEVLHVRELGISRST
jgi:hypothetical protein